MSTQNKHPVLVFLGLNLVKLVLFCPYPHSIFGCVGWHVFGFTSNTIPKK